MKRITKAALGGLAGCALVLGGTQAAVGALEGTYKFFRADLEEPCQEDRSPGCTDGPLQDDGAFDSAKAKVTIVETTDPTTTTFTVRVTGVDSSAAGQEFAGHLHVGTCDLTGPHYKNIFSDPASETNEAWFYVVPDDAGMALSTTTVGWVPDDAKAEYETYTPGEMSIVIHTGTISTPGPKQACFPLSVPPHWFD